MLFVLFELGSDRYALEASGIVEILPLVIIKKVPQAPAAVAGVFNYRGTPVPVIDLCELTLGRPARMRLGTRIALVRYPTDGARQHLLGLIVEKATETLRRDPADFTAYGVANDTAPYLGPVTSDTRGLIQWVKVERLLPEAVRELLFNEPVPG